MATNIDKALYQQPTGIDALAQDEEAIEIEIVDPEEVNIAIGDMEISIGEGGDDTLHRRFEAVGFADGRAHRTLERRVRRVSPHDYGSGCSFPSRDNH